MDKVYMTYIQATQGGGGWPMSVFLTPDLEPFVGGTYFPPTDQFGRPGFPTILNAIAEQVLYCAYVYTQYTHVCIVWPFLSHPSLSDISNTDTGLTFT